VPAKRLARVATSWVAQLKLDCEHPLVALAHATNLTHLTLSRTDVSHKCDNSPVPEFAHAFRKLPYLLELELTHVRLHRSSDLTPLTTLTKLRLTAVGELPREAQPQCQAEPFDLSCVAAMRGLRELHLQTIVIRQDSWMKHISSLQAPPEPSH
jgi:hypothetical protein